MSSGRDEPEAEPWHNSTRAVLGASAIGVAVIAVLIAAVVYVTGSDDPGGAPMDFVDPSFSTTESETAASTPTTTATITSTTPISTTEINGPPAPPTTSGSSDTTSSGSESSSSPAFTRPRQNGDNPGGPTSQRPRFNITRTLAPQQAG